MGCVQARPPTGSTPHGLEKMKLQNGYVAAPPRRSFTRDRPPRGPPRTRSVRENGKYHVNEERKKAEEGKTEEAPPRLPPKDYDELVEGWPKWLMDNIPREVLAGLVPRSVDSYDKLDKVL